MLWSECLLDQIQVPNARCGASLVLSFFINPIGASVVGMGSYCCCPFLLIRYGLQSAAWGLIATIRGSCPGTTDIHYPSP